ncbi:hypothetical protein AAP_03695 [Ascosphaera apis ARSEF 7405]|uniref:Uncharacterized protein n=1 Tax=Ascosphaera apis ARSEF 7405 TaxID=392613 RepID=A0A166NKJ3_9EURO|nr:hypothetical protein AAP_03695 [Ascosphaera apis ARSEF 7405]
MSRRNAISYALKVMGNPPPFDPDEIYRPLSVIIDIFIQQVLLFQNGGGVKFQQYAESKEWQAEGKIFLTIFTYLNKGRMAGVRYGDAFELGDKYYSFALEDIMDRFMLGVIQTDWKQRLEKVADELKEFFDPFMERLAAAEEESKLQERECPTLWS